MIEDLKKYDKNPFPMNEVKLEELQKSIKNIGLINPIIVSKNRNNKFI